MLFLKFKNTWLKCYVTIYMYPLPTTSTFKIRCRLTVVVVKHCLQTNTTAIRFLNDRLASVYLIPYVIKKEFSSCTRKRKTGHFRACLCMKWSWWISLRFDIYNNIHICSFKRRVLYICACLWIINSSFQQSMFILSA